MSPSNQDPTLEAHAIEIDHWFNENRRDAPSDRHSGIKTVVRWRCSCGRIGPGVRLGLSTEDHNRAARSARNGGTRHVAAMERGR